MTVTVTTSSNQNNRDSLNPPQLRLEFEFNLDSRKKRTAILLNELPKTAEIRNGNKLLVSYPMDLRNRRSNALGGCDSNVQLKRIQAQPRAVLVLGSGGGRRRRSRR